MREGVERPNPGRRALVWTLVALVFHGGCAVDVGDLRARSAADMERPAPKLEPFTPAPTEIARTPEAYHLGVGDVVRIVVYDNEELGLSQAVRPDGMISVLPAGQVRATGKSVDELREEVRRHVAEVVRNPIVNVVIDEYVSRRVAVLGAVAKPGVLYLRTDVTLVEGISQLGGLAADADLRRGMMFRGGELLPVNFERLFRGGEVSQNVLLRAGDVIFVPSKLENKVYMIGELRTPGVVSWGGTLSLLEAFPLAGGQTDDARMNSVLVIRGGLVDPRLLLVDAAAILQHGELEKNIALEPGDVVFVPKSTMANSELYLDYAVKVLQVILSLESAILVGGSVKGVLEGTTGGAGTSIILNP